MDGRGRRAHDGRRPGAQGPDHPLIVGGIGHGRTVHARSRSKRRQTARAAAPLAVPVALGVTLGVILAVSSGPTTAHVNQGTTGTSIPVRPAPRPSASGKPAPSPAPGMARGTASTLLPASPAGR
jgi:hypothetical protein